jgi:hypothetical protein
LETPDIKGEYDAEALQNKPLDDDDEMPHLTPEVDTETLLSKYKQVNSSTLRFTLCLNQL